MKKQFTHVDCFSGVGGFCTGLNAAGFNTVLAIEKVKTLQMFLVLILQMIFSKNKSNIKPHNAVIARPILIFLQKKSNNIYENILVIKIIEETRYFWHLPSGVTVFIKKQGRQRFGFQFQSQNSLVNCKLGILSLPNLLFYHLKTFLEWHLESRLIA